MTDGNSAQPTAAATNTATPGTNIVGGNYNVNPHPIHVCMYEGHATRTRQPTVWLWKKRFAVCFKKLIRFDGVCPAYASLSLWPGAMECV